MHAFLEISAVKAEISDVILFYKYKFTHFNWF